MAPAQRGRWGAVAMAASMMATVWSTRTSSSGVAGAGVMLRRGIRMKAQPEDVRVDRGGRCRLARRRAVGSAAPSSMGAR